MGAQSDALTAFNGLPMGEKHKVLLATNPDYAGLPPAEQVKALDAIHNGPAPSQGLRNNLADRIDQGRGMVERGVTSAMQGMGLPTNPNEADKFVMGDPNESAIGGMVRSHMEAGAKDPVGYVPMLGPIAVRASEHANAGQYPEMAGDLAAGVATVSPFKDVAGRAGTNLGQRVAKATRTSEGDLGPVTSKAASAAGGVAGMTAGYKMTPKGVPPYYGAAAGGAVGGGMGTALADRMIPKVQAPNPTPFKGGNLDWTAPGDTLGPESPTPAQLKLGQRVGAQTAKAEAAAAKVGVPGSAAQEAGYIPPVTKVPIRSTPKSPLTPEQVPGPDTAGKGNLLTPAAKRGDPRAAQETMRRGRQVLYVPAEDYEGTRLQGTLADRMGQSKAPDLSQRTGSNGTGGNGGGNGYKPSEKASTMSGERRNLGPEFDAQQREEMIGRYKGILRHPDATPTDIAEATARLKELGATQ